MVCRCLAPLSFRFPHCLHADRAVLASGAVALELAKERGGTEFWSSAARVLGKVTGGGQSSLPIAHALLVEAEAGAPSFRTSNTKYQKHVQTEWFNWPSGKYDVVLGSGCDILARVSFYQLVLQMVDQLSSTSEWACLRRSRMEPLQAVRTDPKLCALQNHGCSMPHTWTLRPRDIGKD